MTSVITDGDFGGATFTGLVSDLRRQPLTATPLFDRAIFNGTVWFSKTTFNGGVWFKEASFSDDDEVQRGGLQGQDTGFDGTTFEGGAEFGEVTFGDNVMFGETTLAAAPGSTKQPLTGTPSSAE